MYLLKRIIGRNIYMAMEECHKEQGGKKMYEKLDKLREELSKAKKKREDADRKVKQIENKLREAENTQIISDVTALNLTPEQLAEFLKMITTKEMHPTVQSYEEVENLQLEEKESEDEEDEM